LSQNSPFWREEDGIQGKGRGERVKRSGENGKKKQTLNKGGVLRHSVKKANRGLRRGPEKSPKRERKKTPVEEQGGPRVDL